jgi:hypothetical protein
MSTLSFVIATILGLSVVGLMGLGVLWFERWDSRDDVSLVGYASIFSNDRKAAISSVTPKVKHIVYKSKGAIKNTTDTHEVAFYMEYHVRPPRIAAAR